MYDIYMMPNFWRFLQVAADPSSHGILIRATEDVDWLSIILASCSSFENGWRTIFVILY